MNKPSILKETDSTGSRPIHHAARAGKVEVIKYLEGIEPMLLHARNDSNMTVLHFAVQNANKANKKECLETLRFVLARCDPATVFSAADTDQSGELSYGELEEAYGHIIGPTVLKRIFKEVDVDGSGEISLDEFKQALETGALIPLTLAVDSTGQTACHVAANRNNQIAVQFFAKYIPDIMKIRDKDGRLPVHILAYNGNVDTLKLITKKDKGPLEMKDFNNATLAHHAAAGGQEDMVHFLISELGEALLEQVDRNGSNPAHWAARSNKLAVLRVLVDKRPGLLATKNRDGKVARDMCFDSEVQGFLSAHTPEIVRTQSDPTENQSASGKPKPKGGAGAFGFGNWASSAVATTKPTEKPLPPQQEILPKGGKTLAELMKEKRSQRM